MSLIVEADIPILSIKPLLQADSTLLNKEVAGRKVQGIYHPEAPDDSVNPYPCIVIGKPYRIKSSRVMRPNGPNVVGAIIGIDVFAWGRDVEIDNTELMAVRARVRDLLEGVTINISGGNAASIWIEDYPAPLRDDRGYLYSGLGITFGVGSQVN